MAEKLVKLWCSSGGAIKLRREEKKRIVWEKLLIFPVKYFSRNGFIYVKYFLQLWPMRFRFLAVDSNDVVVRGEIISDSKALAEQELRDRGFHIQLLQCCETKTRRNNLGMEKFCSLFSCKRHGQPNWKYAFFEQLAMLLTAGLPIEQCLSTLTAGLKRGSTGYNIIYSLREKISAGMSLSEGMMYCRQFFSDTEIKTVKAAEKIGCPGIALGEMSKVGKKMSSIGEKVKMALIYPAIVLVVAGIALILLMTIVVPKFEIIFTSQDPHGRSLPWLTQRVVNFCNFIGNHWGTMVILAIAAIVAFRIYLRKRFFKNQLPFFGKLFLTINLNTFFRTIGMLMSFGVPLQEALQLSIAVINNGKCKKAFEKVLMKIMQGEALSDSFRGNKFLTATDNGLILAGERSRGLAKTFIKISEMYDRKIEQQLTFLTILIEPAIIIFLAIVVAIVVIAMFLPMINLMQNMRLR
ncbi:MAG: type II secretion system F family protein [Puniceicoccales bacterium]|jgi:type II secretory pathway component PulF|nr:type II secretion system F family protein [Puniceicoccales bacterium]